MAKRDPLLALLARVGKRLWLQRVVQEATGVATWCGGALLVYQALKVFVSASAHGWLLGALFATLCVVIVLAIRRLLSRNTMARTAGIVDERAGLNDELKTAYWLSQQVDTSPLARLQLAQARATASGLGAVDLVPIALPRRAVQSVALLLAAATLYVISPRVEWRAIVKADEASPVLAKASQVSSPEKKSTERPPERRADDSVKQAKQVDPVTKPVAESERKTKEPEQAAQQAAAAETEQQTPQAGPSASHADSALTQQAQGVIGKMGAPKSDSVSDDHLEGLSPQSFGGDEAANARADNTKIPPPSVQGLLAALRAMFGGNAINKPNAGGQTAPGGLGRTSSSAATAANQSGAQSDANEPPSENPRSKQEPERSGGPQEAAMPGGMLAGDGDTAPMRRARGSSGGTPDRADENARADPVLDDRITSLRAQLQRIKTAAGTRTEDSESGDSFYAPTRSQSSTLDYRAATLQAGHATEAAAGSERMPAAYGPMVEAYFLYFNRKEK